jgi:poly-gamma-glutamate capsule biosynthesis protein CapA/YwtB (metallophosphatase superfamily)
MPSPRADRRRLAEAGIGAGLIGGAVMVWRALVFLPETASTPIRLVDGPRLRPASALELPPAPADTAASAVLLFAGDIMQHRRQAGDDFTASYAGIALLVSRADLAIANLEFPVDTTRPVGPPLGSTTFNGSARHVDAIAAAGFDLLQTANNHLYDQGAAGVANTWRLLRSRGLEPVGTAPTLAELERAPVVVREVRGMRVGFVAYTFPPNRYPGARGGLAWPPRDMPAFALGFGEWDAEYRAAGMELFRRHAALARAQGVDLLVALVHWGEEWHLQPSDDQRRAAHDLVDAGFDLVVGGHSHVINGAEIYRGRLIAYSLGDLLADFAPMEPRAGALLEVRVVRAKGQAPRVTGFTWHPTLVERKGHRIELVRPGDPGEPGRAAAFVRSRLDRPGSRAAGP